MWQRLAILLFLLWSVSLVQAAPTTPTTDFIDLNRLSLNCPSSLTPGAGGMCSATASYSDGTSKAVSPTWSSSNATLLYVGSDGSLTAGTPSTDTTVTVNASHTENSKTVSAATTITLRTTVCPASSGEISISGATVKKLGESMDVRYRLCNFNKTTPFDIYVAVQIPSGEMLFLSSSGSFFGAMVFTLWDGKNKPAAYLANTLVSDLEVSVLSISALPSIPIGTYTFYAVPVLKGGNVMNSSEWIGNLASGAVTLNE